MMEIRETTFDDDEIRRWWREGFTSRLLLHDTWFQSWEWNRTWWEFYGAPDPNRTLMLLAVIEDGAVAGIAPLFLQTRSIGPLRLWRHILWIGHDISPLPALVLRAADERACWRAIVAWSRARYPGAWFELHDMHADQAKRDFSSLEDCRVTLAAGTPHLELDLRDRTWREVHAGFSSRLRRSLRQGAERAEKCGDVHFEVETGESTNALAVLEGLSRKRFGARSWFANARDRAFFARIVAEHPSGVLFFLMKRGEECVHVVCCLVHGGRMHYFLSGMNEDFSSLNPGAQNLAHAIRHALDRGCTCFDFLRGTEQYKREFNPVMMEIQSIVLRPGAAQAGYRFARLFREIRRRKS